MPGSDPKLLGFAVVGNISDHLRGGRTEGKFYQGTPKFSPGTKVYLGDAYWGMGGQNIHVIGLRRVSRRFVNVAIHSGILDNLRVTAIYAPKIWTMLDRLYGQRFDHKEEADAYCARVMRAALAERPEKLQPETREGPWGAYEADPYRKGEE